MFDGNECESMEWREELITTAKFHRRRLGTGFIGHMDEAGWRQEGCSFSHCDSSEVAGRWEELWVGRYRFCGRKLRLGVNNLIHVFSQKV